VTDSSIYLLPETRDNDLILIRRTINTYVRHKWLERLFILDGRYLPRSKNRPFLILEIFIREIRVDYALLGDMEAILTGYDLDTVNTVWAAAFIIALLMKTIFFETQKSLAPHVSMVLAAPEKYRVSASRQRTKVTRQMLPVSNDKRPCKTLPFQLQLL